MEQDRTTERRRRIVSTVAVALAAGAVLLAPLLEPETAVVVAAAGLGFAVVVLLVVGWARGIEAARTGGTVGRHVRAPDARDERPTSFRWSPEHPSSPTLRYGRVHGHPIHPRPSSIPRPRFLPVYWLLALATEVALLAGVRHQVDVYRQHVALDRRGVHVPATILELEVDRGDEARTELLVEYPTAPGGRARARLEYDGDLVADRGSEDRVDVVYDPGGQAVEVAGAYNLAGDLAWMAGLLLAALVVAATAVRRCLWIGRLRALPRRGAPAEPGGMRLVQNPEREEARLYARLSFPGRPDELVPLMHLQRLGSLSRGEWPATAYRGPEGRVLLIQTDRRFVWSSPPLLWPLREAR